jgi:hypothetical protein
VGPLTLAVVDEFLFFERGPVDGEAAGSSETGATSPDIERSPRVAGRAQISPTRSEAEITADFCGHRAVALPAWLLLKRPATFASNNFAAGVNC